MVKFLIIRHGESEANGAGFFAGHLDIELSQRGKTQAEATAKYIFENYSVDKIYSSDLKRAYDTAKPVSDITGLKIVSTKELREIFAGDWQGLCFDELQSRYADGYRVWLENIGQAICPHGETVQELAERIWQEILKIAKDNDGKTVVVVTHATPLRTLICRWKGLPIENMKEISWVSNASVTEVDYTDGVWTIRAISEDSHLAELKTEFPPNV